MMPHQRVERPVRIRHHSNVALGADQDRHLGAHLALPGSAFGSIHDFAGMFSEVHALISLSFRKILIEILGAAIYQALAVPPPLGEVLAPGKVFTPATHAS